MADIPIERFALSGTLVSHGINNTHGIDLDSWYSHVIGKDLWYIHGLTVS